MAKQFVDCRKYTASCFLLCNYQDKERKFIYFTPPNSSPQLGHVTNIRDGNGYYALTISNFYENWKEYLVPTHLTYYRVSPGELVDMNGGKPVYLNA